MIICILAYKEPRTVNLLIKKLLKKYSKDQIVLIAPDEETLNIGKKYNILTLRDEGKGKPAALNFVREYIIKNKVKGDVIVFIDGDVILKDVNTLEDLFRETKRYGCAYGYPKFLIFKEPYKTWAKFLEISSNLLKKLSRINLISGYLWGIKISLLPNLYENLFSEDSYITSYLLKKGIKPKYVEKVKYYVFFPSSLKDYIRQRIRTFAGHWQVKRIFKGKIERGIRKELRWGIYILFKYLLRGRIMFFILNIMQGILRIFIWILAKKYITKNIREVWIRIESTKF